MNKSTSYHKRDVTKRLAVSCLVVLLLSAYTTVSAQEAQTKETPYWYVISYKIQWGTKRIDSLRTLAKMYTFPIVAQAKKMGRILDYHLLIHHTGGEYNVVQMTKYPSWAAIDKPWINDAFKVIEPDEAKRKAAYAGFNWVLEGAIHVDNIYTDLEDPR